ncbi:GGDEF domain-containing response regulator [Noviherbaspirillum aerium]|uniref:GGDEF domain-containing response regulator n=1 Tax=Noviherbaspirillum aerium TaxID=2588497 RepID=UPI00124E11FA|nr:diguanylate cyclase [Noviherbaspirillum aerium]
MNQQHTYAVALGDSDYTADCSFVEDPGAQPSTILIENSARLVYLVNSNALLAKDIALKLGAYGYRVIAFDSMAHLAEHLPAVPINPILVDVASHGVDEWTLSEIGRIRELCQSRIPMLLLSAHANMELRLKAAHAGIDAFFIKPLDIQALVDYLDTLCPAQEQAPYRLLLIGNDRQRSGTYADAFHAAGMEVSMLLKPLDMFGALGDSRPELVMMDVETSGCGGVDLTALIRQSKTFLELPIVLLSSQASQQAWRDAIRCGADDLFPRSMAIGELIQAVSLRIERYRALQTLIMRDGLTGLYNHAALREQAERELTRSMRRGEQLTLAMIDLDDFKRINDTYGHPVGDQVLRAAARLLQRRLRNADVVGRYGGEEFAVLLPATDTKAAAGVLDEIRAAFQAIRHKTDKSEFSATFSVGLAQFGGQSGPASVAQLFVAADQALYRAKHAGRNRVEIASADCA